MMYYVVVYLFFNIISVTFLLYNNFLEWEDIKSHKIQCLVFSNLIALTLVIVSVYIFFYELFFGFITFLVDKWRKYE